MRKFVFIQLLIIWSHFSSAQHGYYGTFVPPFDRSPDHLILTINPQDGAYLKKDLGSTDYAVSINGEKVLGTPFLLYQWADGTVVTANGSIYHYPLRYNVYNQSVSFANEKDTLDITEEIKGFSLQIIINDTTAVLEFLHANQYSDHAKNFYYQVVLDYTQGQLLKTNRKEVASLTSGLLASRGTKYFQLKCGYYYYDKSLKKTRKIPMSGDAMKRFLHLDEGTANKLKIDSYDFSSDDDLIRFFKSYFKPE